jgi:2-C-methyl-D-erythritol 2,4-cyclodiphosphate synthase
MTIRIGHGYDVHRFGVGDHIILGGVRIPHHSGLVAHSDGDVVIHAVMDALLGAVALGDIGRHFPDSEAQWAGADSCGLLGLVMSKVSAAGYQLGNLDVTIIAQQPRMAPHIDAMRERIATVMAATTEQINIKATTTEKLGFVGREEGIAVHAVVLLEVIR